MAAVSVEEQLLYIKIEYLRGKLGKEIHENVREACGNNALSFKTMQRWYIFRQEIKVKHF